MTRLRQVPEAPTVSTVFVTVSNYDEFAMPPPVCTTRPFGHSSSYAFSRGHGWSPDPQRPDPRDQKNDVGGCS